MSSDKYTKDTSKLSDNERKILSLLHILEEDIASIVDSLESRSAEQPFEHYYQHSMKDSIERLNKDYSKLYNHASKIEYEIEKEQQHQLGFMKGFLYE